MVKPIKKSIFNKFSIDSRPSIVVDYKKSSISSANDSTKCFDAFVLHLHVSMRKKNLTFLCWIAPDIYRELKLVCFPYV